jgi:D-3-phosphoglycerate dehydrogenase
MKVLVASNISKEAIELMERAGLEVDVEGEMSEEKLEKKIAGYEALIVRSRPKVTARVLRRAEKLKIIGRAGMGFDNIDIDAATQRGIVVVNAPGGNTISTAEFTIGAILCVSRKIYQAVRSVKEGGWERFVGMELRGKTLGIVGLGRVGYEVAKRAKAFEMRPIAFDPYISHERAEELGIELVSFDEIISESDIITVHVPKTKETEKSISKRQFEKMKDGVYIINCARGGIVDEDALYDAIVSGKVAGAALDAYEEEPPQGSRLLTLDNVITTPHIGASTKEAQSEVGRIVAEDMIRFSKGVPVKNGANLPPLGPEKVEYLMPYIRLGEKMGKIASARLVTGFEKVRITFRGRLSKEDISWVTRSLIKGLLWRLGDEINLVSSISIAKERGIAIEETKSETSGSYESLLEVEVLGGEKSISLSGTSFGKDYRIIKIDRYKVDFIPEGHYILSMHEDRPGIIGRVATLLGRDGINIAGMVVGRSGGKPGGVQLMLLLIDDPPSEEVLEEMVALDGITDADYVLL